MPVIAEARVETEDASRFLGELCRHLSEKAKARPEMQIVVERTETSGTADFGWGRCTMQANPGSLAIRAEANDREGLEQVQEFVTRHLENTATATISRSTGNRPGPPPPIPMKLGIGGRECASFTSEHGRRPRPTSACLAAELGGRARMPLVIRFLLSLPARAQPSESAGSSHPQPLDLR